MTPTENDIALFILKIENEIHEVLQKEKEYAGKKEVSNKIMRATYRAQRTAYRNVLDWAEWYGLIKKGKG